MQYLAEALIITCSFMLMGSSSGGFSIKIASGMSNQDDVDHEFQNMLG